MRETWRKLLSDDLKSLVDEAVATKINETLTKAWFFDKLQLENQKSIIRKLVKLFNWKDEDGYQVPPDKVFIIQTKQGAFVSLHYFVYLRLAELRGIRVIAFEPALDGRGEILRLRGPDGEERTYFQLYEHYNAIKENKDIWQYHFAVMLRKTMFKQALAFFYPTLIENNQFSEIAHFDEDEIVERNGNHIKSEPIKPKTPPQPILDEHKEYLIANIRRYYDEIVGNDYLNKVFTALLSRKNAEIGALEWLNISDIQELHALAELLYECAQNPTVAGIFWNKRKTILNNLSPFMSADTHLAIQNILSSYSYRDIKEVGKVQVLEKIEAILLPSSDD